MLKGTRDAVLKRIQPISIHGQMSWEIVFTNADDPDEQLNAARVGPEAIVGQSLEPGDRINVEYLVGVVVEVTRLPTRCVAALLSAQADAAGARSGLPALPAPPALPRLLDPARLALDPTYRRHP